MFGFGPEKIFSIPALLIALTIHEYAHARLAVAFGDPTPRVAGRVTLNPIAHLDPIGLIMLWAAGFGWAKPVPINPYNFRNGKQGVILVSLAGVGANFLTALVCAILIKIVGTHIPVEVYWVLQLTIQYNIILAVFNLIPIPPLDGSQIVTALLPGRQAYAYESMGRYGSFILMALVFTGIIGTIMNPFINGLWFIIRAIVSLIF
ncbi:MAG: site-2 protease family protein [Negativicutes bacterium]|nr:site-2 protease family protein [Negativicutes bacterium]